jgi:hypothetical protein
MRATMEKCSGLPAKQRKLNPLLREVESTSKSSRLDIVPVEILSEILHHVASPKDVLSVARCNKRLRATLLNPSNVMIWRRARSNCVVPGLPPPPLDWSESAYAAFIFDSGICHVCRTHSYPFFIPSHTRLDLWCLNQANVFLLCHQGPSLREGLYSNSFASTPSSNSTVGSKNAAKYSIGTSR